EYFEAGKKFYEASKFSEATIEFLNAVKRDPSNRDSRYYLALSYEGEKNFVAAVKQLTTILDEHPDDVQANLALGNIYVAGGARNADLYRQAKEKANTLLSKEPQNVEALVLSGNASLGLSDFATAVKLFQEAIAIDPKNIPALIGLGTSRLLEKNLPEAAAAFV